jgi:hypothetical protein
VTRSIEIDIVWFDMGHHIDGQRPIVVEVVIERSANLLDNGTSYEKLKVAKIGLAVQTEIFVGKISAADDGYPIVNNHCLIVHPMVEPMELGEVENLPGNKSTGSVLERIEHAVFYFRMFCQGHQHPVFGDEKRIID